MMGPSHFVGWSFLDVKNQRIIAVENAKKTIYNAEDAVGPEEK